jgi:hypothetical protein
MKELKTTFEEKGGAKLIPAIVLGVSLVVGPWIHGYYMSNRVANNLISVTGSAKKTVDADLAKWSASFTRHAGVNNLKENLALANSDAARIKKFILDVGIPESSITFLPIQSDTVYSSKQGDYSQSIENVVGYNVHQEVRVEDKDIGKVDLLAKNVSTLIDQGIIADYQNTQYFYTKLDDLRPTLFAEATKDAKTRAEAIASGTGVKVGDLRNARTGIIQVLAPNSTDVSDYGTYDLSTKAKEISATVNVSFELR